MIIDLHLIRSQDQYSQLGPFFGGGAVSRGIDLIQPALSGKATNQVASKVKFQVYPSPPMHYCTISDHVWILIRALLYNGIHQPDPFSYLLLARDTLIPSCIWMPPLSSHSSIWSTWCVDFLIKNFKALQFTALEFRLKFSIQGKKLCWKNQTDFIVWYLQPFFIPGNTLVWLRLCKPEKTLRPRRGLHCMAHYNKDTPSIAARVRYGALLIILGFEVWTWICLNIVYM